MGEFGRYFFNFVCKKLKSICFNSNLEFLIWNGIYCCFIFIALILENILLKCYQFFPKFCINEKTIIHFYKYTQLQHGEKSHQKV